MKVEILYDTVTLGRPVKKGDVIDTNPGEARVLISYGAARTLVEKLAALTALPPVPVDYAKFSKDDLIAMAKDREIEVPDGAKKADLVKLLGGSDESPEDN